MSTKGFTLIEALLVLSVIAILSACFPFLRVNRSLQLTYQMKTIYHKLLYTQGESMAKKKTISVDFLGDYYQIDGHRQPFDARIDCSHFSFHFTPLGTVSKAGTIVCTLQNNKKKIVLELGSGRIYVK